MIRKRGGWLSALFLGEMLTATAMSFFEGEIARAVVLALFVPLIISSGGNSGSQAASLIIRALALRELKLRDWFRVFRRELISGLALGSLLGVIGFFRIVAWQHLHLTNYGEHYVLLGFTVWASLIGVVMFGTLAEACCRSSFVVWDSTPPQARLLSSPPSWMLPGSASISWLRWSSSAAPCYEWRSVELEGGRTG